jgi:hypothetical protein
MIAHAHSSSQTNKVEFLKFTARFISRYLEAGSKLFPDVEFGVCNRCIRQHTSAYGSIRQHTSAYVSIHRHTSAYISIRQHTAAYVRIRQHTSAYVSIRQHTSA